MRWLRDQRGYTLVEIIVAMSIFAVVLVIAVGAFVSVQRQATKSAAERRVQQDVRYNLETLARQTRSASIDYAFYASAASDARCSLAGRNMLALLVTEAGAGNVPVTKRVYYYGRTNPNWLVSKTYPDVASVPSCVDVLNASNQVNQTANNVSLDLIRFYVAPTADPATDPAAQNVQSPIRNTHPRVTVLLTARTGAVGNTGQTAGFDSVTVQTTLSTRAYPLTSVYGTGSSGGGSLSPEDLARQARDSQRVADLQSIHNRLMAFQSASGYLPTTDQYGEVNGGGWDYSSQGNFLQFLGNPPAARDPINDGTGDVFFGGSGFAYAYYCYPTAQFGRSANVMGLGTKLERPQDYAGNPNLSGNNLWSSPPSTFQPVARCGA